MGVIFQPESLLITQPEPEPKRLIVLVEPKSGWARQNFLSMLCAGHVSPKFSFVPTPLSRPIILWPKFVGAPPGTGGPRFTDPPKPRFLRNCIGTCRGTVIYTQRGLRRSQTEIEFSASLQT